MSDLFADELYPKSEIGNRPDGKGRDHVILCGLHNLGFRILEQLREAGLKVVVIDDDPDPRLSRQARRWGVTLIEDDSRIPETLIEAGIYQASAIIACEENDLHNLEIVLAANDMVKGIRAVASFFNQNIGEQLTQALANSQALSLSEKAGPSFVEACDPSSVLHLFHVQGENIAVVEAEVERVGTIQRLYGNVTPLVVRNYKNVNAVTFMKNGRPNLARSQNVDNRTWEICPPHDFVVQPGQYVTLMGQPDELRKLPGVKFDQKDLLEAIVSLDAIQTDRDGTTIKQKSKTKLRRRQLVPRGRRFVANILRDLERPFRYALLAVGLIIVFTTFMLWMFYHSYLPTPQGTAHEFTLLDALYFTVTIIATVGFGDYNFAEQEWPLKIFGIMLILVGAASMSVVYAYVTNFIISRRIEQAVGRQRATEMENHVILCGLGSVGYQVMLGLLEQGKQVAVIEKNEHGRFNSEASRLGVPLIFGDARLPQVLKAVNLHKARAIAFLTSDALANLESAMTAHSEFHSVEANRNKWIQVVMRVFDNNLAERVARTFNIETIYSTSSLAAPYYVAAALDYEVVSTFYLERRPFIVAKLVIKTGSKLGKITVQQFYEKTKMPIISHLVPEIERKIDLTQEQIIGQYLHIRQLEPNFHPSSQLELNVGDTIVCVGPYERIVTAYKLNKNQ